MYTFCDGLKTAFREKRHRAVSETQYYSRTTQHCHQNPEKIGLVKYRGLVVVYFPPPLSVVACLALISDGLP